MPKSFTILFTVLCLFFLTQISEAQNSTIDSLVKEYKKGPHDTIQIKLLLALTEAYARLNPDSVIPVSKRVLFITDKLLKDLKGDARISLLKSKAMALNNIGFIYDTGGDIKTASDYYLKSLKLMEECKDQANIISTLNDLGYLYSNQGNIEKALYYFNRSLNLSEANGDKKGKADALAGAASIYLMQGDSSASLKQLLQSLDIYKEINWKEGEATCYLNIAFYYQSKKEIPKALELYAKALKIKEQLNDLETLSILYNNIGGMHFDEADYNEALKYFVKAINLFRLRGNKEGITTAMNNVSNIYLRQKKHQLALAYADTSLLIAREIGFPEKIAIAERTHSVIDGVIGDHKAAFLHYKQYIIFRDSINNEGTRKASMKSQLKYEFEKKEAVLKEQQEKERVIAQEKDRFNKIVIFSVVMGLVLVIAFALWIFRTLKITKQQKLIIEDKQKEILDSIHYAKRIQNSLLPSGKYIQKKINKFHE